MLEGKPPDEKIDVINYVILENSLSIIGFDEENSTPTVEMEYKALWAAEVFIALPRRPPKKPKAFLYKAIKINNGSMIFKVYSHRAKGYFAKEPICFKEILTPTMHNKN